MADRLQKEELLYDRSEAVFIEWAKENSIQIQSMSPIEDNAQNRYHLPHITIYTYSIRHALKIYHVLRFKRSSVTV